MKRCVHGLACAVALFAASCGETRTEEYEVEVGFQGEARRNPLLAAETLLEELGRDVESVVLLETPTDDVGVLIVSVEQLARSQAQEDSVYAWVERGGQLVVTVFGMERPARIDALVIERCDLFGRYRVLVSSAALKSDFDVDSESLGADGDAFSLSDTEWSSNGRSSTGHGVFEDLKVDACRVPRLDVGQASKSIGRLGVKRWADAATFEHGAGRVTLLSSGSIFWNGAIAQSDNAQFLWTLVEPAASPRVVFVHGRDETLWQLLVQRAPQFVAATLALIALALWRLTGRFGPTIVEPPPVRHAFADHIAASGRFLWRHAGPAALVEPLRQRALRAIARRHALGTLSAADAVAAMRDNNALTAERVEQVLLATVDRDPTHFVAFTTELHQLERAHD